MALDPDRVQTPGTAEFWMSYMAGRLLDRNRTVRLGRLHAYLAGTPPMPMLAASDRRAWYQFQQISRVNMARRVIRAKRDRMRVRSIHTAATTDDRGDMVAWRYWTRSGLIAASSDVHNDQLAFSEGYVRVSVTVDGTPVALQRDPRFCIAIEDPLDPLRTLVGFELLWDEMSSTSYAYLWMRGTNGAGVSVGQQFVAVAENVPRPRAVSIPGVTATDARDFGWWWPALSFNPSQFTMRPRFEDVAEDARDGGPYCQTLAADVVPLFRFPNREDEGEFERAIGTLDRINRTVCDRVIIQAIQAYKQRALEQPLPGGDNAVTDRLPAKDDKGNPISWDEIFQPGPDALWKLPPGVKIWESQNIDLKPIMDAVVGDVKILGEETDTPFPGVKDDVNESADGAQYKRENHLAAVDAIKDLASLRWAQVVACMFLFAPDADRFAPGGRGKPKIDRADASQIIIDWFPTERHSLAERADADSKNKTLSLDDAARVIWGMSPDEVAINRQRRKDDISELPALYRLSALPAGLSANEINAGDTSALSGKGATPADVPPSDAAAGA